MSVNLSFQEVINKQKNKKRSLFYRMIRRILIWNPDYDFLNIYFKDYKKIESRDYLYLKIKNGFSRMSLEEKKYVEWKLKDSIIEIDKSSLTSIVISTSITFINSFLAFFLNSPKDDFGLFEFFYLIFVTYIFLFVLWISISISRIIKYSKYYNFLLQILLDK